MSKRTTLQSIALAKTAQIVIVLVILVIGLAAGYLASNRISSPTTLTITNDIDSTITQIEVQQTMITTTSTRTEIFTNTSLIQSLQRDISSLGNSSALQQWELRLLTNLGKEQVNIFYVNETWTIMPNSNVTLVSESGGYNGTMYFSFDDCPFAGSSSNIVNGQHQLFYLLSIRSPSGSGDGLGPISTPYSVFLKNIGNQSVTCTGSLALIAST